MTEWVELGTDTMRAAMKAQGLSHERAARQVPVSEKTWRRWVERGEVPVHLLPKVAAILNLEIEEPKRVRVGLEGATSAGEGLGDRMDRVEERLGHLEGLTQEILDAVQQRPAARRRSG